MSEKLEKALAEAGNEHAPPAGWQQRVWNEVDRKAQPRMQWLPWMVAGVASGVAMVMTFLFVQSQRHIDYDHAYAVEKQRLADERSELARNIDEQLSKIRATDEENDKLVAQLRASQDAAEQKRIQAEIEANRGRKQAEADQLERLRQADVSRRKAPVRQSCKDKSDPLCGM